MSNYDHQISLPKSWEQAAIDSALPKLPAGPTSLNIVSATIAELAARLQEIKKFLEYDPREMKSTVLKTDYGVVDTLAGHTNYVSCLQALPDGRIVSGSGDYTLRIWSRNKDGQWESEQLRGHTSSVRCLQALPDGRIVSGSGDNTLRIWDGTPIPGVS